MVRRTPAGKLALRPDRVDRLVVLAILLLTSLHAAIVATSPWLADVRGVAMLIADVLTFGIAVMAARSTTRDVRVLHAAMSQFARGELPTLPATGKTAPGSLRDHIESLIAAASHSDRAGAQAAVTDALTELPNRRRFLDALRDACDQGDGRVAVMFIDLDGFKAVNDALGHAAGDRLLAAVARRLASVTANDELLARMGGDEFTVLIRGTEARERALALAAAIAARLRDPIKVNEREIFISASVGVADGAGMRLSHTELMRRADVAVYRSKAAGRGTCTEYDPTLDEAARDLLELDSDLHRALTRNELVIEYQPELDLRTGAIIGMEALVRWRHPTKGLLGPGKFIPLAEESGEITQIGRWVLSEACERTAELNRTLPPGQCPLIVSVNVSSAQLTPAFVGQVRAVLDRSGLAPAQLRLEITESILLADFDRVRDLLQELKRLGILIAIDDFGTGFSSLSYLHQLPIDVVKIDQSFVRGLDGDDRRLAIVKGICILSRAIGAEPTAEGVETPEQVRLLRAAGCESGQGYLFSRSLPRLEFEELVRASANRGSRGIAAAC